MKFWTGNKITSLENNEIFVFGSNPSGWHGAGAAKDAVKFGAVKYRGRGLHGQTYALITKNLKPGFVERSTGITYEKEGFRSVSKQMIVDNIKELYELARANPNLDFLVTYKYETWPDGGQKKSLNGYTGAEMFEMFTSDNMPYNIVFHESYKPLFEKNFGWDLSDSEYVNKDVELVDNAQNVQQPVKPVPAQPVRQEQSVGQQQSVSFKSNQEFYPSGVSYAPVAGAKRFTSRGSVNTQAETPDNPVETSTQPAVRLETQPIQVRKVGGGFRPSVRVASAPVEEEQVIPESTVQEQQVQQVPEVVETPATVEKSAPVADAAPKRRGFAPRLNLGQRPDEVAPTDAELNNVPNAHVDQFIETPAPVETVVEKEPIDDEDLSQEFKGWGDDDVAQAIQFEDAVAAQDEVEPPAPTQNPQIKRTFSAGTRFGQRPVEEEQPIVDPVVDEDQAVVNQEPVDEPQETPKKRGFSAKLGSGVVQSLDNQNQQPVQVADPTEIDGVPVVYLEDVRTEDLIPMSFLSSDETENNGFNLVSNSGEVKAVVLRKSFLNNNIVTKKSDSFDRNLDNVPKKEIKDRTTQLRSVLDSKTEGEPKAKEKAAPATKKVTRKSSKTEDKSVKEDVASVAQEPVAEAAKPEVAPVVEQVRNNGEKYDPYGDADEYPDFLQGQNLTNEAVESNTTVVRTSFESEQDKLSADDGDNYEDNTTPLKAEEMESIQAAKEADLVNDLKKKSSTRKPFVRLKDMPVEERAIHEGNTQSTVSDEDIVVDTTVQAQVQETVVDTQDYVVENIAQVKMPEQDVESVVQEQVAEQLEYANEKDFTFFFSLSSPFSNFHPAKFFYEGLTFCSTEQFMMLAKAQIFNDMEAFDKLLEFNEHPLVKEFLDGHITSEQIVGNRDTWNQWNEVQKAIKGVGRSVKGFNQQAWESEVENWMVDGISQKVIQNPHIEKAFRDSKETTLVEASQYDKVWGIGLNKADALKTPIKDWPGANKLGKVLERVRSDLVNNLIVVDKDPLAEGKQLNAKEAQKAPVQAPVTPTPVVETPKAELVEQKPKAEVKNSNSEYHFFYSLYSPFSNFHPAKFEFKGLTFSSVEQFYVFAKAKYFKDEETANKVMAINDTPLMQSFLNGEKSAQRILKYEGDELFKLTLSIKAMGKKFARDDEGWNSRKDNVMGVAIREKFLQNQDLREKLFAQDGKKLVEASKGDTYWGAGLSKDVIPTVDPQDWPGLNKLGNLTTSLIPVLKERFPEELKVNKPARKSGMKP